jgi:hypothetical protein
VDAAQINFRRDVRVSLRAAWSQADWLGQRKLHDGGDHGRSPLTVDRGHCSAPGQRQHGAPQLEQKTLAAAAIAAVMLFAQQIAFAQNSSQDQRHGSVRNLIKSGLEQAGFTNIQIVPEAFLVHATDPDGNPVSLMVPPDRSLQPHLLE